MSPFCLSIAAPSYPIGCVLYTSLIALPIVSSILLREVLLSVELPSCNKAFFGILRTHLLHPSSQGYLFTKPGYNHMVQLVTEGHTHILRFIPV